jgi:hypothetical protein
MGSLAVAIPAADASKRRLKIYEVTEHAPAPGLESSANVSKWKFSELAPNSKAGCAAEGCKKYADYEARMQKRNGLFRFVWKICAFHKLMLERKP